MSTIEQIIKEFEEKFKCHVSGCNNDGTISEHDCDGTDEVCSANCPVPAQCQFCFEVLLPIRAFLRSSLQKMYEAGRTKGIEESVEIIPLRREWSGAGNLYDGMNHRANDKETGWNAALEETRTRLNSLKEKTK